MSPPHVSLGSMHTQPFLNSQPTQISQVHDFHNEQLPHSSTTDNVPKTPKFSTKQSAFPHGKKMPKSTTKYKGVWQSNSRPTKNVGGDEDQTTKFNAADGVSGSETDSEGDYLPPIQSSDDDSESDEGGEGYVEENIAEVLEENYVDARWDAFRPLLDVYLDDGGRLSKIYKNGEVYDDAELGKIRCNWRIHASKLVDEHTWAIKTLQQSHNSDLNLVNNRMVNCEWAAQKLLEDIRANPNIKAKGIDPSLDEVWAKVNRRYCARHLCKNFKKDYPGIVMHKLFTTSGICCWCWAVMWFQEIGPLERWARWRFHPDLYSDANTNNFVESFNSTIGVDRCYPILTLLEGIRRIAMVRHATRKSLADDSRDDGVCPNIRDRVRILTKDSRTCNAYPAGRGGPVSMVCGRLVVYHVDMTKTIGLSWICLNYCPNHERSIGRPSRNRKREEGEQKKGKRSSTISAANAMTMAIMHSLAKEGPQRKRSCYSKGDSCY
ncbi:E3 ubiquitin-protein ligase rififylin [Bienertia sinuspersici]